MQLSTLKTSLLCTLAALPGVVCLSPASAHVPPKHVPPKHVGAKTDGGMSKGTAQLQGGDGVFGVVYTMQSGYNLSLLKARYTIESQLDYTGTMAMPDQKVFVLTMAVKNPQTDRDVSFGGLELTLVDEDGNNYTSGSGCARLAKLGSKELSLDMKPGQGFGQDPLTNELSEEIVLPATAKIVKIMIKDGRANIPTEKVMRYNIAGYPGGSPKNIIAPLPKYAADPTDPKGATALSISPAVMGKYYPSGYFSVRLDSVTVSTTEPLHGEMPEDGKEWVIMTLSAKNTYSEKEITTFEVGDEKTPTLRDADGEKYRPVRDKWKASSDEEFPSTAVEFNDEVKFRWFFQVPKGDKLKSLTFAGGKYSHTYQADLSTMP